MGGGGDGAGGETGGGGGNGGRKFNTKNLNFLWNRRRRRWDGKERGIVAATPGREIGIWEGGWEAHHSRWGRQRSPALLWQEPYAHHTWKRSRRKCV